MHEELANSPGELSFVGEGLDNAVNELTDLNEDAIFGLQDELVDGVAGCAQGGNDPVDRLPKPLLKPHRDDCGVAMSPGRGLLSAGNRERPARCGGVDGRALAMWLMSDTDGDADRNKVALELGRMTPS